ncbi:MAG TPA: hypothetical protein V6C65_07590 [Allocoleopsis sp.]
MSEVDRLGSGCEWSGDLREGLGIDAGIVQVQSQGLSGIVVDSWIKKIDVIEGGDRV